MRFDKTGMRAPEGILFLPPLFLLCPSRREGFEDDLDRVELLDRNLPLDSVHDHFMPNAVPIAGIHHLVHNLSKDLDKDFVHREESQWRSGVKIICACLYQRDHRERSILTCLHGIVSEEHAAMFEKGFSQPHWEKRWGSIVKTCQKLDSLFSVFWHAWPQEKFNRGGGDVGTEVQAADVTAIVQNSKWWRYLKALIELHEQLDGIAAWADGCSCHERLLKSRPRHEREVLMQQSSQDASCRFKGKRAAELAAGAVAHFLEEIVAGSSARILAHKRGGVTSEKWQQVLSDYERGRSFIW